MAISAVSLLHAFKVRGLSIHALVRLLHSLGSVVLLCRFRHSCPVAPRAVQAAPLVLGLCRQEPYTRRLEGSVLASPSGGEAGVPRWQVIVGVVRVMK